MNDSPPQHWTVDKKVPLALIFAMLVQFALVAAYIGTVKSQGEENNRRIAVLEGQRGAERVAVLEAQSLEARALLLRMDDKLTRLVERPKP